MPTPLPDLPIVELLPSILASLDLDKIVTLAAQPGAGKTTLVPLYLRNATWLGGKKIIMLEPRQLAAINAAKYISKLLGETVGNSVGYRVRGNSKTSKHTRIEIITEGILVRLLQDNPELEDTGLIIFDEFHERSLHADLALALALDTQRHLRPDIRILIMSATLDQQTLSARLGNAPMISSPGRSYPIDVKYIGDSSAALSQRVCSAVRSVFDTRIDGDILVFLPGRYEIERSATLLAESQLAGKIQVTPLYADLAEEQQQRALEPADPGKIKVILATNVAETSLTIPGVRVVIDSGLAKIARFDSGREMNVVGLGYISKANAIQRAGRAGREAPGFCYRLYSEYQYSALLEYLTPEIERSDLSGFALELALWGSTQEQLTFINSPPAAQLACSQELLHNFGLVDQAGRITSHGKKVALLGTHPRLAHMLVKAKEAGQQSAALACLIAALLEERDLLTNSKDPTLSSRLELLLGHRPSAKVSRILAQARRLAVLVGIDTQLIDRQNIESSEVSQLLALAYADRVAQKRPGTLRKYLMANGCGVELAADSGLEAAKYIVVAGATGKAAAARVTLAEAISESDLRTTLSALIISTRQVRWDSAKEAILAAEEQTLGSIVISSVTIVPEPGQIVEVLLGAIRSHGLTCLDWDSSTSALLDRARFVAANCGNLVSLPVLTEQYLLNSIDEWLAPGLVGLRSFAALKQVALLPLISAWIGYDKLSELQKLAPEFIPSRNSRKIRIEYRSEGPVAVGLIQDFFGLTVTPSIANGQVKVTLELLNPARRPIQKTQDLARFWRGTYQDVRRQLKSRYPKHRWPEDPSLG